MCISDFHSTHDLMHVLLWNWQTGRGYSRVS
jgi:hypothetical protein